MPIKDMATTTAAFGFTRTLSSTIGISIGNAIYSAELRRRLPKIPGIASFVQGKSVQQLSNDVKGLTKIEPVELRHQVLHAYTKSVSLMWIVYTPVLFSAFLAGEIGRSSGLKGQSLKPAACM